MNIPELAADPALFQRDLYIPTGTGSRKFGDVMAPFQKERFKIINPSLLAVARHESPPIPRLWDERTKGSSKDTDHAANLLWLLAFCRRPLRIQVGAYDAQQAGEVRLIVKDILRIPRPLNRLLADMIEVKADRIVNRRTDSTCEILTTDSLGSHGSRPDVVLIDELTHQRSAEFAETLMDNADKMPASLVIIATNSGFDPSWQLEWKKTFAGSPRWRVLEYRDTPPWITRESLREAERRNSRNRFLRLWRGLWVGDTEGALDDGDVENCVTQTGPMTGDEPGWLFAGGLDIGLRKHSTGFVVIGKHVGHVEEVEKPKVQRPGTINAMIDLGMIDEPAEETEEIYHEPTHRLRLAHVKVWKPKPGKRVSLEAVKTHILNVNRRFHLSGIALDPHQGEMLAEQLQREGVPVVLTPQTTTSLQDQATSTVEAFQQRTIDLFDHPDMLADLKRLQVKDTGLRIRLVSPELTKDDGPGTGHGDLASALSFAIALEKSGIALVPQTVRGIIIAE